MKRRPDWVFVMRLALALGMTKRDLCERMDVAELREWMAFDRYIEPFGRDWEQTGVLAALTIAPHVKGRAPKPQDFMPIRRPPMTAEEIAAELGKLRPNSGTET
jgi:hypothetical protein